jgi:pantoate--beta-alanine ligase
VLFDLARTLAAGGAWREAEARGADAVRGAGFQSVDYVAVRGATDLSMFEGAVIDGPARVLAAARVGGVRLIDNVAAEAGAA